MKYHFFCQRGEKQDIFFTYLEALIKSREIPRTFRVRTWNDHCIYKQMLQYDSILLNTCEKFRIRKSIFHYTCNNEMVNRMQVHKHSRFTFSTFEFVDDVESFETPPFALQTNHRKNASY